MITRGQKFYLNRMNSVASKVQLGTLLRNRKGTLKCIYDVSADASRGVTGASYNLKDEDGNDCVLPSGAIITQVYFDIVTAFTSTGNNGTIALDANTGGDLLAAVDADTLPLTASHPGSGVPIGTAATMVKLTADRTLKATVATNSLLTGKMHVFVDYVLSTETE